VLFPQASGHAADAWARLLRAHAAATRILGAQLAEDHGLTLNDYDALLHLSRADGGCMRRVDLADRLLLTASGVTRLLERLEETDLVERASCPADRRVTYAVITDRGRERLAAASHAHLAAVRVVLEERLSDEELAQLAELLGRLPGAGAASGEECSPG
jgi:DNA-binding MarR family transcriptional regulator